MRFLEGTALFLRAWSLLLGEQQSRMLHFQVVLVSHHTKHRVVTNTALNDDLQVVPPDVSADIHSCHASGAASRVRAEVITLVTIICLLFRHHILGNAWNKKTELEIQKNEISH